MNLLIPDSWLRQYLNTKATPLQIKEYLSLSGPSVERIHADGKDFIYDIEVTGNRPDSMSVVGIAREASVILPRFGMAAELVNDPYKMDYAQRLAAYSKPGPKSLTIKTDPKLNPRWTSIVLDKVKIGKSPKWLTDFLEKSGVRSINNIIDITNYLMAAFGQPAHAFDYDAVKNHTMTLRLSKKGEKITTLDGKSRTLPGDDIVIADGSGRLIDLCGIMGAENSSIKETTKTVILFLQTYDPGHIRKTSMKTALRSQAASLFEKGLDSELVMPVAMHGVSLIEELAGGTVASRLYDIYPKPYKNTSVSVDKQKIDTYLGCKLKDNEIKDFLQSLGFNTKITERNIEVSVPSFRRDVEIDVDVIEEIARIFGYQNIPTKLPDREPPVVNPLAILNWEEEIKVRLRDWGYTETQTYSMISEPQMDLFGLNKAKTYKIANPLSSDWVYMRPTLIPSALSVIKENQGQGPLRFFELSMIYGWRPGDLPLEIPTLIVYETGDNFRTTKGIAEAIFSLLGIEFPTNKNNSSSKYFEEGSSLDLGDYGQLGLVKKELSESMGINGEIAVLILNFAKLAENAKAQKQYRGIPKYPPIIEDFSFILPVQTPVGPIMEAIKKADPLVSEVLFTGAFEDTRTFRVMYQSKEKNLTDEESGKVRKKIINMVQADFNGILKGQA